MKKRVLILVLCFTLLAQLGIPLGAVGGSEISRFDADMAEISEMLSFALRSPDLEQTGFPSAVKSDYSLTQAIRTYNVDENGVEEGWVSIYFILCDGKVAAEARVVHENGNITGLQISYELSEGLNQYIEQYEPEGLALLQEEEKLYIYSPEGGLTELYTYPVSEDGGKKTGVLARARNSMLDGIVVTDYSAARSFAEDRQARAAMASKYIAIPALDQHYLPASDPINSMYLPGNHICWAACSASVANYLKSAGYTSAGRYAYRCGVYTDTGVDNINTIADHLYTNNRLLCTKTYEVQAPSIYATSIDNGKANIVRLESATSAHAVVVRGYNLVSGGYQFSLMDPWTGTFVWSCTGVGDQPVVVTGTPIRLYYTKTNTDPERFFTETKSILVELLPNG